MQMRFFTFLLITLSLTYWSCGDDDDNIPLPCPDIEHTNSLLEMDEDQLFIQEAEVRITNTLDLDIYEFLIRAVGTDCNELIRFRFNAAMPVGETLAGTFPLLETNVYTANSIISFTRTSEVIEPFDIKMEWAEEGLASITSHGGDEYTIAVQAELRDGGGTINLNIRYDF